MSHMTGREDEGLLFDRDTRTATFASAAIVIALVGYRLSTSNASLQRLPLWIQVFLGLILLSAMSIGDTIRAQVKRQGTRLSITTQRMLWPGVNLELDSREVKAVRYGRAFGFFERVQIITERGETPLLSRLVYRLAVNRSDAEKLAQALGVPFESA